MTTHLEELPCHGRGHRLASPEQVNNALTYEMASAITAELAEDQPTGSLRMNGGLIIAGRLLARLDFLRSEVSYLHATRYGHQLEGNSLLDRRVRPTQEIKGRCCRR